MQTKPTIQPNTFSAEMFETNQYTYTIQTSKYVPPFVSTATKNDIQVQFYQSLHQAPEYFHFGMPMPSRTFTGNGYRFGFNGAEKENDIYGEGNLNIAKYWVYDTRLGRRWNLDPVDQINMSNYATFGNNPIIYIDPIGDKIIFSEKALENEALMQTISDLYINSETYRTMYDLIDASGNVLYISTSSFLLDEIGAGGAFVEGWSTEESTYEWGVAFYQDDAMEYDVEAINEEMFHFFQKIEFYNDEERESQQIEFEAKFFNEIVKQEYESATLSSVWYGTFGAVSPNKIRPMVDYIQNENNSRVITVENSAQYFSWSNEFEGAATNSPSSYQGEQGGVLPEASNYIYESNGCIEEP